MGGLRITPMLVAILYRSNVGGGGVGQGRTQFVKDVAEGLVGVRGQCVTMEYGALEKAKTRRRQTQQPAVHTRF